MNGKDEFLVLMKFPREWVSLDMYPDELWDLQREGYRPGHEVGSEHDRNGAFHWWLKRVTRKEQLLKLVQLSFLDPDQVMARDVRRYIRKNAHADADVLTVIEQGEAQG